jgi:arginase
VRHAIIEVPAMAGDPGHPAADGPAVLTASLEAAGWRLPVHRVEVPRFDGDARAASIAVCRGVADRVRRVVAAGDTPVVLAGSCDVAPGVLAGLGEAGAGVVWIDAHADFNTPESSASGFWPGMTLAVVVGDCGQEVWSALGWRPVPAERVGLFGVRSLSPAEETRRLERSSIRAVGWRDGTPEDDVAGALDELASEVERVYVHLDLDALDPTIGSAVVDPPVPGGLSEEGLSGLVGQVHERFAVIGATIATYTPAKDRGPTLRAAMATIRVLIRRSLQQPNATSRPDSSLAEWPPPALGL